MWKCQCRDARCPNCVMLKSSISLLMKLADDDGRNYLQNFIADYFNLSDIGLNFFFNIEKSNETKERIKTFDKLCVKKLKMKNLTKQKIDKREKMKK